MRASSVWVVLLLFAVSFLLQNTANAQMSYVTIYGQLIQFQCPVGDVSGPCTGISLITNGTTAGIPNEPMLDFSQSVVAAPAQTDFGKIATVTGYYGQESPCSPPPVNGCPAFFVHIWGPYIGPFVVPTSTASSNPQLFLSSANVYSVIPIVLVILLGLVIYRNKIFR